MNDRLRKISYYSGMTTFGMLAFIGFSGCSSFDHAVYLQNSLNETALASIQPNDHLQPRYLWTSDLPNPVVWMTSDDPLGVPHNFNIDINGAFGQDLNDYVKQRFPSGTATASLSASPAGFEIHLSSFTLNKHLDGSGRTVVDTSLVMETAVWKNGTRVSQKSIQVGNEASAYVNMIPALNDIFSRCVDGNLNKAIILLDKFLTSSGL